MTRVSASEIREAGLQPQRRRVVEEPALVVAGGAARLEAGAEQVDGARHERGQVRLPGVAEHAAGEPVGLLERVEAEVAADVRGVVLRADPEHREEPAGADVAAALALVHHVVLARDDPFDQRGLRIARAPAQAGREVERDPLATCADVDVGLHREREHLGLRIADLERGGAAQVEAELQPVRRLPQAVEEAPISPAADRSGLVAAVGVEQAATRRRDVAGYAPIGAHRELELGVGLGAPAQEAGQPERDRDRQDQSHRAPSSIHRATSSISGSGSGESGGITSVSRPTSWWYSRDDSEENGVT